MGRTAGRLLKWTSILAIVAAAAVGGYHGIQPAEAQSSGNPGGSIPTAEVREGPFARTVSTVGELRAARSYPVAAPHRGQVVRLVPEGTRVEEGDPIFWLDTQEEEDRLRDEGTQLELAIRDLRAAEEEYQLQELLNEYNLQSELSRVELAEQRLQDAEQKYEAERILVERAISPRSRLDEAELSVMQARVELRNARINLRKTEENLASNLRQRQNSIDRAQLEVDRVERRIAELEEQIENATVRAPATGEVSYLRVWRSGSFSKIAEGDQLHPRHNVVEIPDRSRMLAVVPVSEIDVSLVQSGQPVEIMLDAVPGQSFRGTVERKSVVPVDAAQSTRPGAGATANGGGPREFEVLIRMDQNEDIFFQGMTATATIDVKRLESALYVPLEALTLEDGELGIFRTARGGPQFVPVTVLLMNNRHAAVNAELAAGDPVYLRHPGISTDDARERGFLALREARRQLDEPPIPGTQETPEGLILSDAGNQ